MSFRETQSLPSKGGTLPSRAGDRGPVVGLRPCGISVQTRPRAGPSVVGMFSESLFSRFARRASQRHLHFGSSRSDLELPAPDAGRKYLLYLHVPFCIALCPFCSFHRVEYKEGRARAYFDALRREIRTATDAGYGFRELYVGGGTPTILPDELERTILLVRDLHALESVSVETHPADLDQGQVALLQSAGVSRLSIGVQSFDDRLLREMGRLDKYGSGAQIRQRLRRLTGIFETLNVDMIFNFPDQSEASLIADLDILGGEVQPDQVSYYPLMTATGTRRMLEKKLGPVRHDREKRLYRLITRRMLDAGYHRSSAWNFDRDSLLIDEYIINQDEYLGLGSGSFSYIGGDMYASTFSINHYIERVNRGRTGIVRKRDMRRRDQMLYYLLTRLFAGSIDLDAAERRFAGRFRQTLLPELFGLRVIGAVKKDGRQLWLTERGYYLWVVLMREFFSGVNNFREEMRLNIPAER